MLPVLPATDILTPKAALYISCEVLPITVGTPSTAGYLQLAGFVTTLALTLWSTFLIAYRIHSTSRIGVSKVGRIRFNYIAGIVIQSAAIHSAALLLNLVIMLIPTGDANMLSFMIESSAVSTILAFTTVMSSMLWGRQLLKLSPGICAYAHGRANCSCAVGLSTRGRHNSRLWPRCCGTGNEKERVERKGCAPKIAPGLGIASQFSLIII